MKRILHVSKYYPPYAGGIEDVCFNIVKLLSESYDYQQKVVCFSNTKQTCKDMVQGIEVIRIGIWKKIASQPLSLVYRHELKKILKQYYPDVVHFHAPNLFVAWILLSLLPKKTKLIVHWHSDVVDQKLIYKFVKPIETHLLKRANIIIATSPNYIDYSNQLQKFKNKVIVVPNVIDASKFELSSSRMETVERIRASYRNLPIILFVGRHVPYKGLVYLIEAAKSIMNECAIVIGGTGPLTEKLKQAARNLNHVHFVGRIPDEELVTYYYAADIFVFPSITKNEAFGVALAEAMYCRTPAITFTIEGSGVNWVNLNGITGIEVANSDVFALRTAIENLLGNQEMRRNMAIHAKERVMELFVLDKMKDKLKQLY